MSVQAMRQEIGDTMRYLRPAGLGKEDHPHRDEKASECLQPDLDPRNDRPTTPANIQKYRKSYQNQPGLRFYSVGLVDQPLPPPSKRYGVRIPKTDCAGDCFEQMPKSSLMGVYNDQKESIYDSHIKEPLGQSYSRNHTLPDADFAYGVSSNNSENAKQLIYFNEAIPDQRVSAEYPELDPTFHKERDITRQINRQYNWESAGLDPTTHRFGRIPPPETESVRSALTYNPNVTKIGSRRVHEIRNFTHDRLGTQREIRGTLRQLGSDFVFGRANTPDEWGTKKTLVGAYSQAEQQPDKDLGVSVRKLNPLETIPFQKDHVYGCPSIRTDLAAPELRSVADPNNYGDEHNAKGLLYPSKFAYDGVQEEEFLRERSKEEVREVFSKLGKTFSDSHFERIAEVAARDFNVLSVDSFRHAMNKLTLEERPRSGRRAIKGAASLSPLARTGARGF
jgi:hypothetical protein